MLYIKILGMLLVVTASYGIGKTIGVYQNRRVETGLPGWLCSFGRKNMLLLLSRSGQAVSEV